MFRLIILVIALLDLVYWRWADRRLRVVRPTRVWRGLLAAFVLFQLLILGTWFLSPTLLRTTQSHFPKPAVASIFVWHLLVLPASMLVAAGPALARGVRRLVRGRRDPAAAPVPAPVSGLTRRDLLAATGAALPPVLLCGGVAGALRQLDVLRVRRMQVALPNVPPELDGLTITHLTDTHVGRFTDDRQMRKIVDACNALGSDLTLFTGDLIDYALADLPAALDHAQRLDARYGVAMCIGNHDMIESGDAFIEQTQTWGQIPLLLDGARTFTVRGRKVEVLGSKWNRSEHLRDNAIRDMLKRRDPEAMPIVLTHHPHGWDPAAAAGVPLTLAGHTHGGQIMLNERVGAGFIAFRYVSGLYRRNGTALVVSNGAGNWFPLRVNAPAEIIHITVRAAASV